jgi:hypothetical protein
MSALRRKLMEKKQAWELVIIAVILGALALSAFAPHAAIATTTSTTVYGTTNKDAYAESGYPDIEPGNQRNLYLGYDTLYNKYRTRIYIKFNLPSFPSTCRSSPRVRIPAAASSWLTFPMMARTG